MFGVGEPRLCRQTHLNNFCFRKQSLPRAACDLSVKLAMARNPNGLIVVAIKWEISCKDQNYILYQAVIMFIAEVGHFNMGVYEDWLDFEEASSGS